VETAHGCEVVGQGVRVSHLQLLDQELEVGGDKLPFGAWRRSAVGSGLVVDGGKHCCSKSSSVASPTRTAQVAV
jgi:hypothetical protein